MLLLSLPLFSGCAGSGAPQHRQMAALPSGAVCRVAVLPFVNDSDFLNADAVLAKVLSARLQDSTDYLLAQDGDVLKAYRQLGLLPGRVPDLEQLQIIADRVDARLLISGIVLEMREDRGDHGSVNPVIVLEVQIRDGRSGEVLWTTFHRRQGADYKKTMHFGSIHTITGLSRRMVDEVITLWLKKGLTQCNV
jgi:hypothetical protein